MNFSTSADNVTSSEENRILKENKDTDYQIQRDPEIESSQINKVIYLGLSKLMTHKSKISFEAR